MLMISTAKILCSDNVTNVLVSTHAIELMKIMTRLCKTKSVSAMTKLQQPSYEIAHSFDKLLVLQDRKINHCRPTPMDDEHLVLNYVFSKEDDANDKKSKHFSIADLVMHQSANSTRARSPTNDDSESNPSPDKTFFLSLYHSNSLEELKSFHQLGEELNNDEKCKCLFEALPIFIVSSTAHERNAKITF